MEITMQSSMWSILTRDKKNKQGRGQNALSLQLVEKPKSVLSSCKNAGGELEGAKPASNWIKCPAKPCAARRAESEARIFVLRSSTKIWHYFRLQKVQTDFFDSLKGEGKMPSPFKRYGYSQVCQISG